MNPTATDRLRGMMLLSAYGDALGADHETQRAIHSAPIPKTLPEQTLLADPDKWGYWITQDQIGSPVKGVTTDDTAFKLFILHPWLRQILEGNSDLNENAFRQFIYQLKSSSTQPTWLAQPRNAQIDSWLDMYRASEVGEQAEFFIPEVPIVFGLFMFLELAAVRTHYRTVDNYRYFHNATVLDQGYAKSATGFLMAIASLAFSSDPADRFDNWFVQQSINLADELISLNLNRDDVLTITRIVETMTKLGERQRGSSPHEFMVAFEQAVVRADTPPFMDESFQQAVHDPFRMLAEMYAATAYAAGDPFRAIQPLAFGSGDSDTVSAFLGTVLGIWFGEKSLRQNASLDNDLTIVESVLRETFEVDLNQHVELFLRLQGEGGSQSLA